MLLMLLRAPSDVTPIVWLRPISPAQLNGSALPTKIYDASALRWAGIKRCGDPSVRPSVCLSHALAQNGAVLGYGYYRTLIGNSML